VLPQGELFPKDRFMEISKGFPNEINRTLQIVR
jgi:hypothetical protein